MDEFLRRVSAIEPGDVEHLALVLTDRIEHLAAILDELEAIRTEQDATLTELGERLEAADAVDHEEVADESLTVAAQLDEMARYNDEVTAELRVHREILDGLLADSYSVREAKARIAEFADGRKTTF
ncbi:MULTISPECIES: hypothetical protein [unclassified Haladaptatus]|uniref:hypothetical protein n=1 Tax=unclassified Haladaptatus TaxID=2622732 RepID=UPI0023E76FBC|nr:MULTISPECIES: hypothetical protein [unclassified Haladaptatus]